MDKINCKLNENHCAIDKVKRLPCGNICCLDCIKQTLNVNFSGGFICEACHERHALRSANDLLDIDMDNILKENENEIMCQLRTKLETYMRNIEGKLFKITDPMRVLFQL